MSLCQGIVLILLTNAGFPPRYSIAALSNKLLSTLSIVDVAKPAYTFLIKNGVKVYTLEDLHCLNHLITNDLDENIKKKNSKIIKQLFSANLNRLRTKKIVDLMEKYVNRVN